AGTGDYVPKLPLTFGGTSPPYGRGWSMTFSAGSPLNTTADPTWRRGTGFLSVGELANVRHPASPGSANGPRTLANYGFRFDAGNIDPTGAPPTPPAPANDYVSAIATLVALGDWVTVRSDVFTVYGVLRGEDDTDITDTNFAKQQLLRSQDA